MGKNIILCADGTGNKGGSTPDSNVYKIYNAIDTRYRAPSSILNTGSSRQIKFYDNGVGTGKNRYLRVMALAFGFGFGRNVRDLYRFLAKNYRPGDKVFLFGFSRGAATVRALSGFIAASGLVKGEENGTEIDRDTLEKRIKAAFQAYKSATPDQPLAKESETSYGAIPIKCIGVWDTVSTLGWPKDWIVRGVGMFLLNLVFRTLDFVFDRILRCCFVHHFYNYELTENVEFAYQALAIDEERKSFRPMVWNEKRVKTEVEQVWFAGVHSNVGGGYERAGLADVALDWMMTKVAPLGLEFKEGAHEEVKGNATAHGQLYNSRDGLALFYRYHPREIEQLCSNENGESKLQHEVKIHHSVFERMDRRTANYALGHLPYKFKVIDIPEDSQVIAHPTKGSMQIKSAASDRKTWNGHRSEVDKWVSRRKGLHGLFIEFAIFVALFALWFWIYPPLQWGNAASGDSVGCISWLMGHLADILNYFLPVFFEGLVTVVVLQYPALFWVITLFLLVLWGLRVTLLDKNVRACEATRSTILQTLRVENAEEEAQ